MVNKFYLERLKNNKDFNEYVYSDLLREKEKLNKYLVALCLYFSIPDLKNASYVDVSLKLEPILNYLLELDLISTKFGNDVKAIFQSNEFTPTHQELYEENKASSKDSQEQIRITRDFYVYVLKPIMNELNYPSYTLKGEGETNG